MERGKGKKEKEKEETSNTDLRMPYWLNFCYSLFPMHHKYFTLL